MEVYIVVVISTINEVRIKAFKHEAEATIYYSTTKDCTEKRLELHDLQHGQSRLLRAICTP